MDEEAPNSFENAPAEANPYLSSPPQYPPASPNPYSLPPSEPAQSMPAPESHPFPLKWIIISVIAVLIIGGLVWFLIPTKSSNSVSNVTEDTSNQINNLYVNSTNSSTCTLGNEASCAENTTAPAMPAGVFCQRQAPYYRYIEWVFFNNTNSITDNPNRKQIWWISDIDNQRKDRMEDYEITDGEKHYFNRIVTFYNKNVAESPSYTITQTASGNDVCTSSALAYHSDLTNLTVQESEVSNNTLTIGGKTCYLLKTKYAISGSYRTYDCINKEMCEYMIINLGNTGEKMAAIKLDDAELPLTSFGIPDVCLNA
jgi:hypothetical protein